LKIRLDDTFAFALYRSVQADGEQVEHITPIPL
jgi:hypothetical protein